MELLQFSLGLATLPAKDFEIQERAEIFRLQQVSMERAILSDQNISEGILTNIRPNECDCCQWRFVSCTESIVTTFVLRLGFTFGMQWLPQTVAFLHTESVFLDAALDLSHLPRNLRYCYLSNLQVANFDDTSATATLNFSNLPPDLEEFLLVTESILFGRIYIPNLPQNLRVCFVWGEKLKTVLVANSALPASLEWLFVSGHKAKVRCIDERYVDSRVYCRNLQWMAARGLGESSKKMLPLGRNAANMCGQIEKIDIVPYG